MSSLDVAARRSAFRLGPRRLLKPTPILDGNEYGRISTAFRHHLGAFLQTGIEQLAEASLRILDRPALHVR